MAKSPNRPLKVFQAQFGFYDTVVAAPSRAAALRAWGTHQNLFQSGDARQTTDEAAMAAARANPETPLRRAVGSDSPFLLDPKSLPKIPGARKRPAAPKVAAKAAKPKADRSRLDAAEAALHKLDDDRKAGETALKRRQDDLDAERARTQIAYLDDRKAATSAIVDARRAYRRAGGET